MIKILFNCIKKKNKVLETKAEDKINVDLK